ncbi:MAG: hypothetical protein ABH840_01535 [Nanoarchaeota archaeon]
MDTIQTKHEASAKLVGLDEIVGSGIVLLDGCVKTAETGYSFSRDIYHSHNPTDIPYSTITRESGCVNELSELLDLDNVFTTQDVAKEFFQYLQIMSEKRKEFSKNHGNSRKSGRGKKKGYRDDGEDDDRRQLFEELHDMTFNTYRQMVSKIIPNNYLGGRERIEIMEEMVQLIDSEIGLKKDNGYMLGEHDIDRAKVNKTDDNMVAAALCLSMYAKGPVKILTQDSDFISLLGVVPRLIGAQNFLPHNTSFRDSLRTNPVIMYLKNQEGYDKKTDTSDDSKLIYSKDFRVHVVSTKRNLEIRDEIGQAWKRFNECSV